MSSVLRALAAIALVLGVQGTRCRATTAPDADFVQNVRIEPSEPRKNESITIVSTVTNRGSFTKTAVVRICMLGLGGTLRVTDPPGVARCAGVSTSAELSPGESVEQRDVRIVSSPAGRYVLTVEHLLDPARTARLEVLVRD